MDTTNASPQTSVWAKLTEEWLVIAYRVSIGQHPQVIVRELDSRTGVCCIKQHDQWPR